MESTEPVTVELRSVAVVVVVVVAALWLAAVAEFAVAVVGVYSGSVEESDYQSATGYLRRQYIKVRKQISDRLYKPRVSFKVGRRTPGVTSVCLTCNVW